MSIRVNAVERYCMFGGPTSKKMKKTLEKVLDEHGLFHCLPALSMAADNAHRYQSLSQNAD